jgi:cytosine deaminase
MCSGAIALYKIPRVVIGEDVNFSGEVEFLKSRGVDITIINDPALIAMMRKYIEENPAVWNEDIGE